MKNNLVRQITFSGLLLALTILFTRILAIQNIPVAPFIRISIGPALIVFTSVFLGPVCGAVVGAGSDILGILIFPSNLGYSINPLFTLVYALFGIVPYFIFKYSKRIQKDKTFFAIITAILGCLWVFVTVFSFATTSFTLFGKTYTLEMWQKWLITSLSLVLSALTIFCIYRTKIFFEKKAPEFKGIVWPIALASLVAEFAVMLVLNSIFKTIFFEVNFLYVFFAQAVVFFIDIPLNTFIASYLYLALGKITK